MMSQRKKPDHVSLERDSTVPEETQHSPPRRASPQRAIQDSAQKDETQTDEALVQDEAVKTFYLDVSASNRSHAGQATDMPQNLNRHSPPQLFSKPASPIEIPTLSVASVRQPAMPAIDSPRPAVPQKLNVSQPPPTSENLQLASDQPAGGATDIPRTAVKQTPPGKQRRPGRPLQRQTPLVDSKQRVHAAESAPSRFKVLRHSIRNLSSLGVSLLLHLALLLLLSFYTLATLQSEPDLELLVDTASTEEVIDFNEIEIDPTENLEEISDELDPNQIDTDDLASGQSSFSELTAESSFSDVTDGPGLMADGLDDVGELFGEDGQGLADLGQGTGKSSASFFGSRTKARRIVYLIDNTGSMQKGELETVISELLKSVDALDKKQQFYVLFFSDQVYPLFFPRSSPDYLRPTRENRQKLGNWLATVECCTGGVWQLIQGLEIACKMRPDVIFLLSDGNRWNMVRADYKVQGVQQLLTTMNANRIPIHTLGMGCQGDVDRENLAAVAKVNSGTFREVQVHPDMVELAKRKKRPYHNHGPGEIWGSKVPKKRDKG